ncbi:SDR family NAD(P)-dependent oxidoreductase [Flexivirga oryzae]|uniref:NAD(P)-dependent dehydrogenase (Short-subunit alcohol dehydrogenase family) n=1 Tax=Flexivirga oryzae TaxID=1794944 RepID=A0A839N992_9MICO|nr:SDR family NAD(P)-dependent oxidoreductase [Flexivirga oryzae]MBB2892723.1 NAD(P)-dependent dehydrogenase (short-subunit alcohol dehydrogenase family) [Flexivirga oryzae]
MKIDSTTVALVTGAGSGLGEATARKLSAEGASAVLLDLPTSKGAEVAESLGDRAQFVAADVTDEEQVQAAVDAAANLGTLRIVANCAGVATPGRIISKRGVLPLEAFSKVVQINLIGTFNVLRLAAEKMVGNEPVDGDRGVITMTASIAAYDGQIGQAAYASSKAGIVGLTLTAARDLADKGIRVVTIAPGTFETPMLAGLPNDVKSALEAQVPHPSRLGRPEEYASLVAHIVDNQMLNGEVIRLDGALRMPPR